MTVTEKQRHDLIRRFEEAFGPEHAETLMELLPPVGWADVVTKQDLEHLRVATEARFDLLEERVATKDDLRSLHRDVAGWIFAAMGIQTAVIGLLNVVLLR
jgi:hypothetical protein